MDGEGRVYVADETASTVWVFEATGELSRRIGREGEGPGEFTRPSGVFVTGRSLWVMESGIAPRLTQFDAEDRVLGTTTWPFGSKYFGNAERVGDRVFAKASQLGAPPLCEIVVMADDLQPVWDVRALPAELAGADSTTRPESYRVAFRPDGGWVGGWPREMRLWYYAPDGTLQTEAARHLPKRVVTSEDVEAAKTTQKEGFKALGVPPEFYEDMIERREYPDTFPILDRVELGPRGTFWARRNPGSLLNEVPEGVTPDWYVFDGEGAFLGVAHLPEGFEPHRVMGDLWYGRLRGAYDVESVGVFRVTMPEGGTRP